MENTSLALEFICIFLVDIVLKLDFSIRSHPLEVFIYIYVYLSLSFHSLIDEYLDVRGIFQVYFIEVTDSAM